MSLDGCIEWDGARAKSGYGVKWEDGRAQYAHRLAYSAAYGPIPDGMFVCHSCDNPPCVNPAHLFIGTDGDNVRDMTRKGRHWNQLKERCPKGHAYDEANTIVGVRDRGRTYRVCRTCRNAWRRAHRARTKEAAA